jgi:NCS1 family nucleobase:cation symporter-1
LWPMRDKLAVNDLDYFGTFGDAPVIAGVEELELSFAPLEGQEKNTMVLKV